VKSRLAAYAYPRAVEFVDDLPMTPTGKIRRGELRARAAAGRSGLEPDPAPLLGDPLRPA